MGRLGIWRTEQFSGFLVPNGEAAAQMRGIERKQRRAISGIEGDDGIDDKHHAVFKLVDVGGDRMAQQDDR